MNSTQNCTSPKAAWTRTSTLDNIAAWLAAQPASMVVRLSAELTEDIRVLTSRAKTLERELATLTKTLAPNYWPCTAAAP